MVVVLETSRGGAESRWSPGLRGCCLRVRVGECRRWVSAAHNSSRKSRFQSWQRSQLTVGLSFIFLRRGWGTAEVHHLFFFLLTPIDCQL